MKVNRFFKHFPYFLETGFFEEKTPQNAKKAPRIGSLRGSFSLGKTPDLGIFSGPRAQTAWRR